MEDRRILVQKNSNGKVKYHQFDLKGPTLTREHGLIGGAIQGSSYTYDALNKGKSNELTAIDVATADFIRITNKKIKEGYQIAQSLTNLPKFKNDLTCLDLGNIPTGFCLSKPSTDPDAVQIDALLEAGKGKFFVKYNGGCHFILIDPKGKIKILTRRLHDHTAKYPNIVKEVAAKQWPRSTLVAVELNVDPLLGLEHMWAFKRMSKIIKTDVLKGELKPDQSASHKLQEKWPVKAAVFCFLYYDGRALWKQPYGAMLGFINSKIEPLSKKQMLFRPQEAKLKSYAEAVAMAKEYKLMYEGFVFWHLERNMEITMNGKPNRVAAWKIKVQKEKDVIALAGIEGKRQGKYGSIKIGQYDAHGNMVDLGTVGGLKHTQEECEKSYWTFPCVIEVEYDNIFPDTGKLQFGHFSKVHEEKTIKEVEIFSL